MIERMLENLCRVLRIILGTPMALLAVPLSMQVLSRYTGIIPTYLWTEEFSTFIFVWVVMIGSMVAVWEGTHFDVVVTPDAKIGFIQSSVMLQANLLWIYISVPIAGVV